MDEPSRLLDLPELIWSAILGTCNLADRLSLSLTGQKGLQIAMLSLFPVYRLDIETNGHIRIDVVRETCDTFTEMLCYQNEVSAWSRSSSMTKRKKRRTITRLLWRHKKRKIRFWFQPHIIPPATLPQLKEVEVTTFGEKETLLEKWSSPGVGLKRLLDNLHRICTIELKKLFLSGLTMSYFTSTNLINELENVKFNSIDVVAIMKDQEWTAKKLIAKLLPVENLNLSLETANGIEMMYDILSQPFENLRLSGKCLNYITKIPDFNASYLDINADGVHSQTYIFGEIVLDWINKDFSKLIYCHVDSKQYFDNLLKQVQAEKVHRIFYELLCDEDIPNKRAIQEGYDIIRPDGKIATIFEKKLSDENAADLFVWNHRHNSIVIGNAQNNFIDFVAAELQVINDGKLTKVQLLEDSEEFSRNVSIAVVQGAWFKVFLQFVVKANSTLFYEHQAIGGNRDWASRLSVCNPQEHDDTFVRIPMGKFTKSEDTQVFTTPFEKKVAYMSEYAKLVIISNIIDEHDRIIVCWKWELNFGRE